ncbi:MAG: aminotransferase class I/II-fold pyridoxal phosphate-dependent enzyme [Bacillota bacterium]
MEFSSQREAPLLEALLEYAGISPKRFHIPGHGGGGGAPPELARLLGEGVFNLDVTELPGLDDLNCPSGVIDRAQKLAASAFGADRSFFLTGGSTLGLQALVLASGRPGDRLILPRNCHRSVVGGLILAGIDPVFVSPVVAPGFDFAAGTPPERIRAALGEHPGARAVICIHPTYYGTVGDTAAISRLAGSRGIPLLADEAHGSHLYFHPGYPAGALESGADAAVQSWHKTGGSLTQSSALHLKGPLMDGDRVSSALRLLQTSSPSYILMASLDAARRQMAVSGREIFRGVLERALEMRRGLSEIRGIEVLGPDHLDGKGIVDFDPSRVVVRVGGLGISGYQAAGWLARERRIYTEMSDANNIVLVLGPGTAREDCRELVGAIKDLAAREGNCSGRRSPESGQIPSPRRVTGPREAWFAPSRSVRLEQAAGTVSAQWLAVYPPGIPVLVPGEEVSAEMVNYLVTARESGAGFQGQDDPEMRFLRVLSSY